jgi:hypothetical protein
MNYKVLIAAVLAAAVVRADEIKPPPVGWGFMGPGDSLMPEGCTGGVDGDLANAGQPNLTLRCAADPDPDGVPAVVGLQQSFEASPYWDQRVRFSAEVKADGIGGYDGTTGGGGLWIGVPSPNGARFNRAPEKALSGFTDWEYREFVVDIPRGGQFILIGFWLQSKGQLWLRDPNFEVVDDSVPVTLAFEDNPELGPDLQLE